MKIALQLPWGPGSVPTHIDKSPAIETHFATTPADLTLASVITNFGEVALYVGGFMMFFWAAWGVFDYLKAEGNKEALAKARKKIQWAIIGFIILLVAFFISDFLYDNIVKPKTLNITNITPP